MLRHADHQLEGYPNPAPESHMIRFDYEQRSLARAVLARVLWLQGFPDHLAAAEHFLAILFDGSARHALDRYVLHFGRCLEGMLLIKRSNLISGLEHLRTGTDELRDTGFTPDFTTFLGAMAEGLAGAGSVVEGLASIEEAIARSLRSGQLWCLADLLRIKGALPG
jgi:hypothetical protein